MVSQLTTDHNMIEHLLNGLARAVGDGAGTDDQLQHLDGIEAVMETHFRFEEKRLIDVLNAAELGGTKREYLGPLAE